MAEAFSQRLLEYIHRHCPTMDHVDVVLALARHGERAHPTATIAAESHLASDVVQRVLGQLLSTQAIEQTDEGYRLRGGDEDRQTAEELMRVYNTRPVALVRAIYSRNSPIQSFSDAFKIRRKDEP